MLRLEKFSKSYQSHHVLMIDSLVLSPGINWIKGENGSGKTSLFRSLSGISPFEGEVFLNDISLKNDTVAFRRMVTYSEAEPVFPGFLTAKDIVRFIGKTRNASIDQQDYYCQLLGIDKYFTKPCSTFSSGMLKKLSLATAFLGEPRLIILDEPLVTLDEVARKSLTGLINKKLENPSLIFLMSSHQSMDSGTLLPKETFCIINKTIERE